MSNIRLKTLDGPPLDFQLADLSQLSGCELIAPNAAEYDDRRAIWNAMIDRRPGLIAVARSERDVVSVVKFAALHGLLLTIRAGGHNIAGLALRDDALTLDLQDMNAVTVDPAALMATVQPGARLSDVDAATQPHGLAVPTGINSTTGISGLALGGGFGWISRKYGLTIDSLRSARVVLADGSVVVASREENEDLFWALRGGGGNFGVVTQFEFDLHPVGPEVFAGLIVHPLSAAQDVVGKMQDEVARASNDLTVWTVLRKAPPLPFIPENWQGREVLILAFCFIGDPAQASTATDALRKIGKPIAEHAGVMPFADWQKSFDPLLTDGARNYWKSHDVARFDEGAVRIVEDAVSNLPTEECEVFFGHVGGTVTRVEPHQTAWSNRESHFVVNVHTRWRDAADDERCVKWARNLFEALEPHAMGTRYVNFIPEGDELNEVENAFGPNLTRLRQVKNQYDPTNLFRSNINLAA
jgi:FAD/FMN-containing dehydrogenase